MKYGQLLFVYAHYEGDLADIDAGVVREIEQMPSFVDMELFPKVKIAYSVWQHSDAHSATDP